MTYYEILEVRENASLEVISMAYKALARKYHPDLQEGDASIAADLMDKISEAYEILSDAEKRRAYDETLQKSARVGSYEDAELQHQLAEKKYRHIPVLKKKLFIGMAVIVAIIVMILYNPLHQDRVLLNQNKQAAVGSNTPIDNSDEIIEDVQRDNFNKLAAFLGYNDYEELFANEVTAVDSTPRTEQEKYEFVLSRFYISKYKKIKGETNPYTKTKISTFEEYQDFAYTYLTKQLEQTQPLNGEVLNWESREYVVPLTIKTTGEYSYYIKLVPINMETASEYTAFFVAPRSSIDIKVPMGSYLLKYGVGTKWYGKEFAFGADMRVYGAKDILSFTVDTENPANKTSIVLNERGNGSFVIDKIARDEF